jgi:hypothetical protein
MTYPTKIYRNVVLMSRNVIFVLVVNYVVTYLIGFNFIGGYLWYFISGEYTETLSHLSKGLNRNSLLWSLSGHLILPAAFSFLCCILVYVFLFLFLFMFTQSPPFIVGGTALWLLIVSFWAPFLLRLATDTLGGYSITYSLAPILFSALFWFFLDRLHQKYSAEIVESNKVNL